MATPLRVPGRYLPGLELIADMDDARYESLVEALGTQPTLLTSARFANDVSERVRDLDARQAEQILETLISLSAVLNEASAAGNLAEDVSLSDDLDLSTDERGRLAARIEQLVVLAPISLAARAHDVVSEYERVFHDARILTDLRPIFDADVDDGPKAVTMIAMLKVEYHGQRGDLPVESYQFALDESDLHRLRDVVDRALSKAASLKRLAAAADLPYWEYKEFDASDR